MTVYLRLFAGLTSFISNLRLSHFCSMGPSGIFESIAMVTPQIFLYSYLLAGISIFTELVFATGLVTITHNGSAANPSAMPQPIRALSPRNFGCPDELRKPSDWNALAMPWLRCN